MWKLGYPPSSELSSYNHIKCYYTEYLYSQDANFPHLCMYTYIYICILLTRVMYARYEFQGLKTFDRILLGISFSVNVSPTKIRIWHGILYYAPGRKWCCETELGEVSRCESLVTLHHQSYLRTITSNVIIQNIVSFSLLLLCESRLLNSLWWCQRLYKLWAVSVSAIYSAIVEKEYQAWDSCVSEKVRGRVNPTIYLRYLSSVLLLAVLGLNNEKTDNIVIDIDRIWKGWSSKWK